MRHIIYLSLLLLAAACQTTDKKTTDATHQPAVKKPKQPATAAKVLPAVVKGERIDGPANIRSGATGPVSFSLDDNTLVACTPPQKGWHHISLEVDLSKKEAAAGRIKAGSILKVKGKPVGKAVKDITTFPSSSDNGAFAMIDGYTQSNNIKPASVIETALNDYLRQTPGRTFSALQPFIKKFALEKDEVFAPFTIYFNYENVIEDPSPLYRVALIFRNNMLLGIVHTRPVTVNDATTASLERGFQVSWLPGTEKAQQRAFAKAFNSFILSVD